MSLESMGLNPRIFIDIQDYLFFWTETEVSCENIWKSQNFCESPPIWLVQVCAIFLKITFAFYTQPRQQQFWWNISVRGLRQNSSSTLCGTDRRRKRERSSDQGSKTFLFRHSSVEMADLEKGMGKNKLERQETDTSAEVEYSENEKKVHT